MAELTDEGYADVMMLHHSGISQTFGGTEFGGKEFGDYRDSVSPTLRGPG